MGNLAEAKHGGAPVETGALRSFAGDDGQPLVAETWGPADAPAVLFLHGGGQTRHAWGAAARSLAAAGWYTLALDARGHGDSAWFADGDYRYSRMCAELSSLIEQLAAGGRSVAVVGASMGGLLALGVIERQPALLSSLVLVDIAPRMEPAGVERILAFMRAAPNGFATLDEAAAHIQSYLPNRRREVNPAGLTKNLRQRDDGRWVWHWDPRMLDDGGVADPAIALDLDRAARAVRMPTLLIRGRQSDVLSEAGAEHFLALVPHAEYLNLRDAAHMVAGDANDHFTAGVTEFMARVHPSSAGTVASRH